MNIHTIPISIIHETHLVPLLFTLAEQGITLDELPENDQAIIRAHLAACEQCKRQLALIHLPALVLDEHPPMPEAQDAAEPDDDELSLYAAMLEAEGEQAALEAYPAFAEHLAACQHCQERVAADRALIHSWHRPSPKEEAPSPVIVPLDQIRPMWDEPDPRHRLLTGSFSIATQRQWVHVTSPIPAISIDTAYTGQVVYLAEGTAVQQQEERFSIDLRDPQAATSNQPWLRLTLYLRALWSGALLCKLTATLVTDNPPMEDAAEGVAWRIEAVDEEGMRATIRTGTTGDGGSSDIAFPQQCTCLCCIDWQGMTWEIPLNINEPPSQCI